MNPAAVRKPAPNVTMRIWRRRPKVVPSFVVNADSRSWKAPPFEDGGVVVVTGTEASEELDDGASVCAPPPGVDDEVVAGAGDSTGVSDVVRGVTGVASGCVVRSEVVRSDAVRSDSVVCSRRGAVDEVVSRSRVGTVVFDVESSSVGAGRESLVSSVLPPSVVLGSVAGGFVVVDSGVVGSVVGVFVDVVGSEVGVFVVGPVVGVCVVGFAGGFDVVELGDGFVDVVSSVVA